MDRVLSDIQWNDFGLLLASHFDIESLTTPQFQIHVAGVFTSSPTHRCLNVECAKNPGIF